MIHVSIEIMLETVLKLKLECIVLPHKTLIYLTCVILLIRFT